MRQPTPAQGWLSHSLGLVVTLKIKPEIRCWKFYTQLFKNYMEELHDLVSINFNTENNNVIIMKHLTYKYMNIDQINYI